MKNFLMAVLLVTPWLLTGQSVTNNYALYSLQDLITDQERSQKIYLPFLNEPSISAGIYELKRGAVDHQQPHDKDEVYFILKGSSNFTVESETTDVSAGDVIFVRATLDHNFSNISEDLKVLVWFSGSKKVDHDFQWKKWSAPHMALPDNNTENSWNVFLEVPTMITGIYSLPRTVGGDSVLTHQVDEINYVVKGQAKFAVGDEEMVVGPGSIVYVKAGNGHRFLDLQEDFQVYIMFGQD